LRLNFGSPNVGSSQPTSLKLWGKKAGTVKELTCKTSRRRGNDLRQVLFFCESGIHKFSKCGTFGFAAVKHVANHTKSESLKPANEILLCAIYPHWSLRWQNELTTKTDGVIREDEYIRTQAKYDTHPYAGDRQVCQAC
jgi:hypothetical protein